MIKPENRVLQQLNILISHNIENVAISAAYLCDEIGVSRSQLHRILKQETQLSLSHYVRQQRMVKARDLLVHTTLRIYEIADAVGINSHQNFTTYFKAAYDLTPRDYRSMHSQTQIHARSQTENTIAVLPFVNFSNDKEQDYFSDGVTEEIINVLAQVPALKVVGRTSAFAFKNKTDDLRAIGKSLGVNHILEGSVRKAGHRVRITAQLIKVSDGYHLWSHNYDFELDDLFQIQDEISAAILIKIKEELLPDLSLDVNKRKGIAPEAHEHYLKGLYFLNKYSNAENFNKAINYFERTLEIEPTYVDALSALSSCYIQLWFFSQIDTSKSLEKAKHILSQIYKIAPESTSFMVREGHLKLWHYWDFKNCKLLLEKALKASPNNIELLLHFSTLLTYVGDYKLAEELFLKVISMDPLSPILQFGLAFSYWYKGDLDKCEKTIDKLISFKPRFWGGQYLKGVVYLETQRSGKALPFVQKAADLYPSSMTYALVAQTHLLNGNFEATQTIINQIEEHTHLFPVTNFDLGHLYMGLGQFEKSRDYLQKALDAHEGRMLFLIPSCRKIPFIKKHPYFKPFLDYMEAVTTI